MKGPTLTPANNDNGTLRVVLGDGETADAWLRLLMRAREKEVRGAWKAPVRNLRVKLTTVSSPSGWDRWLLTVEVPLAWAEYLGAALVCGGCGAALDGRVSCKACEAAGETDIDAAAEPEKETSDV